MSKQKLVSNKCRRMIMGKRNGKSHRWNLEVYVPNKSGKPRKDGKRSKQEEFMLDYMRKLFHAFDEALKDVDGVVRVYEEF